MSIYTEEQLNQDIINQKVSYTVYSVSDIRPRELNFISNQEFRDIYDYHIDRVNLDFNESISSLKIFFPKTYRHLIKTSPKYGLLLRWYGLFEKKDELSILSFFKLNQRLYFLSYPRKKYDWLPDYLKDGWLKSFGGVLISEAARYIGGKMLIGDPYNCWAAFENYLPQSKKKAKKSIESLVQKIPYTYVDIDIDDIEKQKKHRIKGFQNLRVMIDTRIPDEYPEHYDLLLMCYQYDHRIFWVKDGDFITGIYEISEPQAMLDEYFLHIFSQTGQEYERFDFKPWAKPLQPIIELSQ